MQYLQYPSLIFPIERVSSASPIPAVKFLGVYIDPYLNFKFHLQHILFIFTET